jgi:hypothetical protein
VDVATVTKWAQRGIIGFYRTPGHMRVYPECEVRRVANGVPAPPLVKELADADNARYHGMWSEGWRKNQFVAAAHAAKKAKEAGDGEADTA